MGVFSNLQEKRNVILFRLLSFFFIIGSEQSVPSIV